MIRAERLEATRHPEGLNLEFCIPQERDITRLQGEIDSVAQFLGKDAPVLNLPESGFLTMPLTANQKHELDNLLEPDIAAYITNWENNIMSTPIMESGEKMVSLERALSEVGAIASYSERTFHPVCGEWGSRQKVFWTREGVAGRVAAAALALNHVGIYPHFEDAFRPKGVQEGLFQRRVDTLRSDHPDWDTGLILMEAMTKTAGSPWNAGHKAGAAVDLTLREIGGEPLDLGNEYPDGGVVVAFDSPFITFEQYRTRQIFAAATRLVGMSVYPGEDWHVSFGDALSAMDLNKPSEFTASYGPIKRFDSKNGEIEPYSSDEYYELFPIIL